MTIWTTELNTALCILWGEGHSTIEIGKRMGLSKNQIIGRARRLKLKARPSPLGVNKDAATKKATATRAALFNLQLESDYRFKQS
jgi:GcrA cell cycle regulator